MKKILLLLLLIPTLLRAQVSAPTGVTTKLSPSTSTSLNSFYYTPNFQYGWLNGSTWEQMVTGRQITKFYYVKTHIDSVVAGFIPIANYLKLSGGQNGMKQSIVFNTNSAMSPTDSLGNGIYFTRYTNYANLYFKAWGSNLKNVFNLYTDFGDDALSDTTNKFNTGGVIWRYNNGGNGPLLDTTYTDFFRANRHKLYYSGDKEINLNAPVSSINNTKLTVTGKVSTDVASFEPNIANGSDSKFVIDQFGNPFASGTNASTKIVASSGVAALQLSKTSGGSDFRIESGRVGNALTVALAADLNNPLLKLSTNGTLDGISYKTLYPLLNKNSYIQKGVADSTYEILSNKVSVLDSSATHYPNTIAVKLAIPYHFVTPEQFGAKADGITDCTSAIAAALATGQGVYFGSGTYLTTGNIALPNGFHMQGFGHLSIIKTVTNAPVFTSTSTGNKGTIDNLYFIGSTIASGFTSQHAISMVGAGTTTSLYDFKISNCTFQSMGGAGIYCANHVGATNSRGSFLVTNCYARACNWGYYNDTRGEYNQYSNCTAANCTYGYYNNGGNNKFTVGQLTDNVTANVFIGTDSNDGHGIISGTSINHGGTYNIQVVGTLQGFVFANNIIWAGNVSLSNAVNIVFTGGQFSMNGNTLSILSCTNTLFDNVSFFTNPTTITTTGTTDTKWLNPVFVSGVIPAGIVPVSITPSGSVYTPGITASSIVKTDGSNVLSPATSADITGALAYTNQQVVYGTGSSTVGQSANFTYDNTNTSLTIGGTPNTNALATLTSADAVVSANSSKSMLYISNTSTADNRSTLRFQKADAVSGVHFGDFRLNNLGDLEWSYGATGTQLGTVRMKLNGSGLSLGVAGSNSGVLNLAGSTSGNISVKTQAAAGTYNFNLPTTAGTAGQSLISQGGGSTAMTWATLVDLTTNQSIAGIKTFSTTISATDIRIPSGGITYTTSGGGTLLLSPPTTGAGSYGQYFQGKSGTIALVGDNGTQLKLTASGNGSATTISIAHGLSGVTSTSFVVATARSSAAASYSYVTLDATNVNFIYTTAPVTGTNNLLYNVQINP